MGDVKKRGRSVAGFFGFSPFSGFGAANEAVGGESGSPAGYVASQAGIETPAMRKQRRDAEARTKSAADRAARQAQLEASRRAGIAALSQKRRRGFADSIIVPQTPTLGSNARLGG